MMVNGLVYSVVINATGRLTRNDTASRVAPIICNGPGISPQNIPTATPPATERRCKCHRLGCCSQLPNGFSQRWLFTVSWDGRNLCKKLRIALFYPCALIYAHGSLHPLLQLRCVVATTAGRIARFCLGIAAARLPAHADDSNSDAWSAPCTHSVDRRLRLWTWFLSRRMASRTTARRQPAG